MAKIKVRDIRLGLLWSTAVGTVIALLASSSWSRPGIIALCVVGWIAFLLAFADHGWLIGKPHPLGSAIGFFTKPLRVVFIAVLTAAFMGVVALSTWPPIKRHTLDPKERETFKQYLAAKNSGDWDILLACPANDERACAYATQYIVLFGESGWKVSPVVSRRLLSKPLDGVCIFLQAGDPKRTLERWDAGGYFPINALPVLAVHSAFESIAIEVDGATAPDIPQKEMMIYFGPERENEAEPTDLTRDINWATGKTLGPPPTPQKRW